ncbi:hypothetical protein BDD12DRAFT_785072 [Trichophaea hybrida]|nr:hypothetical protein BDD12DRAFT_785072 [Trichophaea hybrida]
MAPTPLSVFTTRLLIVTFVGLASAAPIDLPKWFQDIIPKTGNDLNSEIQCYALPYGAIGSVSHILTYYTIVLLSMGLSPLTWRNLNFPKIVQFLGVTGLIVGTASASFTIVRCRHRWQFLLIAIWKIMLSISLGLSSSHAARLVKKAIGNIKSERDTESDQFSKTTDAGFSRKDFRSILWWLILYILGCFTGLTGLISLVIQSWGSHIVVLATEIFGGIMFGVTGCILVIFIVVTAKPSKDVKSDMSWMIVVALSCICFALVVLSALYSDWVLAGLAENLTGIPSSDNSALYYIYFGAKRLAFFSF